MQRSPLRVVTGMATGAVFVRAGHRAGPPAARGRGPGGGPARMLALLGAALLLAACIMPPAPETATPTPAVAAPTSAPPVVLATTNANVRSGPGVDHPVVFWLTAGTRVTVTGRNADGTWLQIAHATRSGWILRRLTEGDAALLAGLPLTADAVAVLPTPDPAPAPVGEPAPAAGTPAAPPSPHLTVTGTVVNLRAGPGTAFAIAGQVRAGAVLQAVGRNADGTWLQIADPQAPDRRLWIYGPLTDIAPAARAQLPTVPARPAPAPPAAAAPQPPTPAAPPADCTRLHTVNPNERRLQQITDWYNLDLHAVAQLNRMDPDTPLTAGRQLCLETVGTATVGPTPGAGSQPAADPGAAPPPTATDSPPGLPGLPTHPLSIATGVYFTCAVRADGTLDCWGDNRYQQSSPPGGTFQTVGAGHEFACGLRTDGTVVCWGYVRHPPHPNAQFTALATGSWFACGIRPDATLTCWDGNPRPSSTLNVTPPTGTFRSLGLGDLHGCGVRTDGTLACWGSKRGLQGSPPAGTFTAVSGGSLYSCAIRTDHALVCWGERENVLQPPGGDFRAVDAGTAHACAIRTDGTLACWGDNATGQSSPPGGTFRAVAAGAFHTCAVRTDGATVCWGSRGSSRKRPPGP